MMGYKISLRRKLGHFETEVKVNLEPDERKKAAQSVVDAITEEFGTDSSEEEKEPMKKTVKIKCKKCKYIYSSPIMPNLRCPKCGSTMRELLSSDELEFIEKQTTYQEKKAPRVKVRYRIETDQWIVEKDSARVLEDEGGNYPLQEIVISRIRAIAEKEEKARISDTKEKY